MWNRTVLLTLTVINFGIASIARADPDGIARIRNLEDKLAAAVTARNLDGIMQVYAPDETLFVFDIIPPRQYVGARAYRKDWDDFLGSTSGPLKYDITDVAVSVVGNIAYGHSIQHLVATGVKGDPINLTMRVTDVYRKINGKWAIVQEHISVPIDLDTGKPDFFSRP
jgi:ketosteroid isomerase-like protein